MNVPFRQHHSHQEEASPRRGDRGQARQRMVTSTVALQHQIVRVRRSIHLVAFFAGLLLISLIVPASPVRQALGYGGGSGLINPTCGQPAQVFAKLLKGMKYTLPTKAQLMHLPTPKQHPIALASDANYDPATNKLCAGGWTALYTRFVQAIPSVQGSTNYDPNYGSNFVASALSGLWTSFQEWLRAALQSLIDDATTFGFLFVTPKKLTYGHAVVINLERWMQMVTDAALSLFLVIGGYKYMFGDYDFRAFFPKLLVAAVLANFCLPLLGQFIELCNAVSTGILGALATAGIGDLTRPSGLLGWILTVYNWVTAPEYLVIVYLIELVGAVLLCGQMLLRIAFLGVLLVLAPIGLFLCFGGGDVLPGARLWGALWAQAFIATLIAQPVQLLCLGLGGALIGSFGHSSSSPITILVGIAAIFLAWKIPDLLLSSIVRSRILSAESASDLTQNVVSGVQTGAEMAALVAA